MIGLIPPVAVPLGIGDVARSAVTRGDPAAAFATALARATGSGAADLFGSGRAALAAALRQARALGRDEVVVPAYTCWTVPASVVHAGMRVRLVDLDPRTLDLDEGLAEAAGRPAVAAVVLAHLFARSCDVESWTARLRAACPEVRVVEDAAQAWVEAEGSSADCAVVSFGRGKPLPLGGGGALLHASAKNALKPRIAPGGWGRAAMLAAMSALGRPGIFRVLEALPFLGIGETVYDPAFDDRAPFRQWQGALGLSLLARLPHLAARRTAHARFLANRVEAVHGWSVPSPGRAAGPIRLPVLAPSRGARDAMARQLRQRGVTASVMYPGTLAEIAGLILHRADPERAFPGAREIAERLLTLPVYPDLSREQLERLATAFEDSSIRIAA